MRVRQALVIGAVLITLAGCSGGEEDKPAGNGETSPPAAPLATFAGKAEQATSYLNVMRDLDADLVDDEKLAISNGVHTCEELGAGKTLAEAARSAATRFGVDTVTAQKIVVVAKANLCGK